MASCASCGEELAPTWKYCIHCGAAAGGPEIPSAIRPEIVPAATSRFLNPVVLIAGGVVLFAVGVALVVVAVLTFTSTLQ